MKIQLDTKAKTIQVEGSINLHEFVKEIQKLLPDWKEYRLEQQVQWNFGTYPYPIFQNPCDYSPAPTVDPFKVTCYMTNSNGDLVLNQ